MFNKLIESSIVDFLKANCGRMQRGRYKGKRWNVECNRCFELFKTFSETHIAYQLHKNLYLHTGKLYTITI